LDDYFAQHGKPLGPLHGLPISLKDQFHIRDVETTMGYVGVSIFRAIISFSRFDMACGFPSLFSLPVSPPCRTLKIRQCKIQVLNIFSGLVHLKARKVPGRRKCSKVRWSQNYEILEPSYTAKLVSPTP
jgi:hypothetical protein